MSKSTQSIIFQPENQNKRYQALFVEIDEGQIKLPMFQREFVWEKAQSAKLIDSILRGFPIGTFIFWKTKEELRSYKEIGNHKLPETPRGDYVQYILDGQQRITSLYAIRKGIRITKDGDEIDYQDIFINLDYNPENDDQIVVTEKKEGNQYISVHHVLTYAITDLEDDFPSRQTRKKIEEYKGKLTNYDFSTITIKDYPIEVACEIFSRINTGGKALTVFEIMVAKTYDEVQAFDLAEKFEILRDGADDEPKSLSSCKFETVPEPIIMQCVSAIIQEAVRSRDILKIKRNDFISNWQPMKNALFTAIDFVRTELRVPVSQLLPYPAILVPLAYFFYSTANKKPTKQQAILLEQFFYWAGITERYSSGSESKIGDDLNKMKLISKGKSPRYQPNELLVDESRIKITRFSTSNAYCKSILCLLAYCRPQSFDTGGVVILDNSNLKIASSRNFHHFFPKKFLEKKFPDREPNLIANITLLDGYSNKYRIGAKPPHQYINELLSSNPSLPDHLKTHLVGDLKVFGIDTNDYDTFISCRSKVIANALRKKLNPTQK